MFRIKQKNKYHVETYVRHVDHDRLRHGISARRRWCSSQKHVYDAGCRDNTTTWVVDIKTGETTARTPYSPIHLQRSRLVRIPGRLVDDTTRPRVHRRGEDAVRKNNNNRPHDHSIRNGCRRCVSGCTHVLNFFICSCKMRFFVKNIFFTHTKPCQPSQ